MAYGVENGVTVVDLLPEFTRRSRAAPLFADANHFNEAGHAAFTRIAEAVKKLGQVELAAGERRH